MVSIAMFVFLFFKQRTADDMRISHWSSDVCSSDLRRKDEPSGFQDGFSRRFFWPACQANLGDLEHLPKQTGTGFWAGKGSAGAIPREAGAGICRAVVGSRGTMRKFFGTDGIRGLTNKAPMTAEVAMRVGMAAGAHFLRGTHKHRVVIGKDTRLSGYMLENALVAGFTSARMDAAHGGSVQPPAHRMMRGRGCSILRSR